MTYIVYDLEMTVRRKKGQVAEIIEIGAAKVLLREGAPEVADTFQTFVRPVIAPVLSEDTTSFTGIRQEDVASAETLGGAVRAFLEWIGPEEYYLVAWGPDDHRQLVQECREQKIDTKWILNHNNLQKMLSKTFKLEKHQQMGLKNALEMLEIPFVGSHHRAMDDAVNTAGILVKLFDQLQFRKNKLADDSRLESEIVYKTEHYENLPFAALSKLFPDKEEASNP
ncbi:3'-5' exonuclease [Cohnella fermenti]|uniref:Exonuclease domain-containing protein n=1 Tax=Cohnella fermenti TaxID=2565925 RepID=A0A4S4BZE6_9BACL|nr:3'-5' exonuclease [Cohnella fermenti]THF79967.1 exonuclease domain-containing protein [Cohnella fermenti]